MADSKITDLTELVAADVAHDDLIEVVDLSASANKKVKVSSLLGPSMPADVTGSTYTLALGDMFRTVPFNSISAQTVTIPTNASVAFPIGTRIRAFRKGAGSVKFVGDTGVTFAANLPTGIKPRRFMGVRAVHAGATGQNWTAGVSVPFAGADAYDTDGFHDPSVNNTRLTIPTGLGIKKVNVSGTIYANNISASVWMVSLFVRSDAVTFGTNNFTSPVGIFQMSNSFSGMELTDSQYVELSARNQTDTSIDPTNQTTFSLEVSEIDAQGYIAYRYGTIEIEKIGTDEWIVSDNSALG